MRACLKRCLKKRGIGRTTDERLTNHYGTKRPIRAQLSASQ
ncbi:hypothetical protein AKJ09_08776 [Labilithrix luteola]|uniref:Uncharacterized protein n=1 Tax=Labilithrix luteola TaxID=1391654 RepID=A0A0K1Q8P1_9BACT|nr:hypothetical protein AKJ09_08776 [Labilithrix luteola]